MSVPTARALLRVPRLAVAMALLCLGGATGCATREAWRIATEPGAPRFDELARLEGAWVGRDELVVAFSGWTDRASFLRGHYFAPSAEPGRWWFAADLREFREFGFGPGLGEMESFAPSPGQTILAPRFGLFAGEPPPEALEGKRRARAIDLRGVRFRQRKPRLEGLAARPGDAVFAVWRSEEYSWNGPVALTLACSIRDAPEGPPTLARLELEPSIPPPRPEALLLMPFAAAWDVLVLPPSFLVAALFSSASGNVFVGVSF